jgi:hypothetical protein
VSESPTIGSELVRALERSWNGIRNRHPGVPEAVMITGAGSTGCGRELRLGHFAAGRWELSGERRVAEVFIGGEGLERGGAGVLGTQLHEAAHGLAYMRGVKDSSRQGRYHNRRFRALAEEVGLDVQHHPRLGWSLTTLPERTASLYLDAIAELDRTLTMHREREHSGRRRAGGGLSLSCSCACGRRIRIAPRVLAAGAVLRGVCGEAFQTPFDA